MYEIRKIRPNEVEEALNLALEVFMQFEAPVYKREGVETFKKDIIENRKFIEIAGQESARYTPHLTATESSES